MRIVLLLLSFYFCSFQGSSQVHTSPLRAGWQFRQAGTTQWYKANVPGSIYTDLLSNKLIPDPLYRDNASYLAWVDSVDWEYQCIFNVPPTTLTRNIIKLQFDGLDTYADVYLNGKLVVQANNMFRRWEADIHPLLRIKGNSLSILFHSAIKEVNSIAKASLPIILPDNNRVYARKAQFQFGWDWGPRLLTSGIFKSFQIQGIKGAARISGPIGHLRHQALPQRPQINPVKRHPCESGEADAIGSHSRHHLVVVEFSVHAPLRIIR